MSNLYIRENYLKNIRGFYHDVDMIKVITGVRRCGKSSLMEMIKDEYVQGQPMVQPTMMQQPYPYMMGPQYQGNVGVEPQGMPMGGMPYPGNTPFGMR